MRQLTHPKLQWLLQLTAALKFFPIPHILRTCPPLTSNCFRNWKPSFVVDVLEEMKVSWRRSISSLSEKQSRSKVESSNLKAQTSWSTGGQSALM
jgi:hypothetical protein